MSTELSFRERLAQRANTSASGQDRSYSPVDIRIDRPGEFSQPISLARLLTANGLGLAEAHRCLNELAENGSVTTTVRPNNLRDLLAQVSAIGLEAHAVLSGGGFSLLVPLTLIPEAPRQTPRLFVSGSIDVNLSDEHRTATVGQLRTKYGKAFAKDFKSSAKLADILVRLDPASLQALATEARG